jgi:hypothetical protein
VWDKVAPKLGVKVLFVAVNINTEIDEVTRRSR